MDKDEAATAIRRVIRNEIDDALRACRAGDVDKAKREIEDAETKLKRIANALAAG